MTCLWQAFTNSWWHLFIARFFLGFGIGPKSSTVPVYAAECSPPAVSPRPPYRCGICLTPIPIDSRGACYDVVCYVASGPSSLPRRREKTRRQRITRQVFTAFGIMLGYVVDVTCMGVHSDAVEGLNWRLMLGSPMVPPILVCFGVYFCVSAPPPRRLLFFGG